MLIHGAHCGAEGWERLLWGDPSRSLLGRIPTALLLACEGGCEAMLFGSGASRQQGSGLLEGEAALALARARCGRRVRPL